MAVGQPDGGTHSNATRSWRSMAAERIERTMPSQAMGPSAPENFRLAEIIDVLPFSEGRTRVCGDHSAGACQSARQASVVTVEV